MMIFSSNPPRSGLFGGVGWLVAIAAIAAWPLAASAIEELSSLYGPLLTQCYQQATTSEERSQCIGVQSDACISQERGGESTLGMSQCLYAENETWDVLLNDEYRKTMDWAKAADLEDAVYFPEAANRAKTLRAAQRAWITFRDAECELEYALWGSGSMRHIAGSGCFMRETAKRTIELREKREIFE